MPRPRLLVPGAVELVPLGVGARHEILLGELAGYLLGEDITNWKNTYTFVALDDLSLDDRRRFAPRFADEWAANAAAEAGIGGYRDGGARRPHLARLLRHARLLLVGSTSHGDLGPAGEVDLAGPYRVLEIGFQRNADDYFHLHLRRGADTLASIGGALWSILDNMGGEEGIVETRDRAVDRVIRAATGGLADSAQIALAFWMADVADAGGWETHLAAIAAKAAPHEALGRDIARILREAPEEAETVELPEYGEARRTWLPACKLRSARGGGDLAASVEIKGRSRLALPAEAVWTVEEVDPDPPPMPSPQLFRKAPVARPAERGRRALVIVVIALVWLIAVLIALSRRAPRRHGISGVVRERARAPAEQLLHGGIDLLGVSAAEAGVEDGLNQHLHPR